MIAVVCRITVVVGMVVEPCRKIGANAIEREYRGHTVCCVVRTQAVLYLRVACALVVEVERAKKILSDLESDNPQKKPKRKTARQKEQDTEQMTLLREESPVEKRLRSIDINQLTPMESMNILFELIKLAK